MKRQPTEQEIKEFTKIRKWAVRLPSSGERHIEQCSFSQMEYKYFEGYNLISKVNLFGNIESFESANERMKRYYELDFDARTNLRLAN